MNTGTPRAEKVIDEQLVRKLLRDQHPDLADASMRQIDSGWDNVMIRLDEKYIVRLPRRQAAVALTMHELNWLPVLADRLSVPIPLPVRIGRPSSLYSWPWSIVPWLPGTTADLAPPFANQSQTLSEFLHSLHHPAPENAPKSELRGVPLRTRAKTVEDRLNRLSTLTSQMTAQLTQMWIYALDVPEATESCWLHGDLHARNVLVDDGEISGIIDWGDITAGDAATDIASVWMLFDEPETRNNCLEYYRAASDLVARAKGWAVFFGTALLENGLVDHPPHAAIGRATLQRLCQDS